jgi:glycosyltransferase involved in cell wall biosynthesis
MKVLHYVTSFSPRSETFIYDLIIALENANIDNYVLSHYRELESKRPFSKVNIISQDCGLLKKIFYKMKGKYYLRNSNKIKKFILSLNPNIIHIHFGTSGVRMLNLLAQYRINIPIIISFHGYDINVVPNKDTKYIKELLKLNLYSNVLCTAPSKFLKDKMINLGINEKKIIIVPNAYNDKFKCNKNKKDWKKGSKLKLLSIGRFVEVKGQVYLIKAFAKLLKYYPNAELSLIGYGELKYKLLDLCKDLKIEDKVFILKKEHQELPQFMSEHHLYLQPSIVASDGAEENLSVATIEAQAMGLPAIVSNIGGLTEIIEHNINGKIVEQKDIDAIFYAIKDYIDNDGDITKHSYNAQKIVKQKYAKEKILNKITQVYKELL